MTLKRKGPLPGPFQPSKLKYKCPVFECKSTKIRGDRIAEHFQSSANLIVLDKCNENVLLLRKNNLPAGNIFENSDELLKSLALLMVALYFAKMNCRISLRNLVKCKNPCTLDCD